MKNSLKMLMATAALTLIAGSASAEVAMPMSANGFVTKASTANMFEIESSKVALEKSSNPEVRTFAQQMIDDHMKAGDTMKAALEKSKATEKPATALDEKHQKLMDELQAANGGEFDKKYIDDQVNAHKEALGIFTTYSKMGMDASLKSFAVATLPTLEAHKMHIDGLKKAEK